MQIEGEGMKKETQYKDCRKTSPKEYALMAGVIILGIVFLPVVVILYCIPSVRATFKQLAYEDAMRG